MITEDLKKIIIISCCVIILISLIVVVMLVDIDLKFFKFNSIESLIGKHDELKATEEQLIQKEVEYNNTLKKVKDIQTTFDSEKTKYEAISDETINIIKEATTEENYNIEYMWIRLGNYAKANNLSIVMAEPGGSFETTSTNKDDTTSSSTKTSTSTTSDTSTTTTGDAEESSVKSDSQTSTVTQSTTANSSSNTLFKIQVSGSYLDVSDFIFEVENDNALRFRLDNISMDYVSGTTIRASFNVKNLIINK